MLIGNQPVALRRLGVMRRSHRARSLRTAIARALLYLLPGLVAAAGAVAAFLAVGRVTYALVTVTALLVVLGVGAPPAVDWLRNHYVSQADRVAQERRSMADQLAFELRDHFGPRGRGMLPSQMRGGSYFTGRTQVLRELADWLASQGDSRARVLTGGPGSGKSAVLGRVVLLAGQRHRDPALEWLGAPGEHALPAGAVSVAVHARGQTVDEVAAQIALGLGLDVCGAGDLLAALRDGWRPRPEVIVVDAVDEAADPFLLITELLEPLASAAARTRIRVLAATRPGGDSELLSLFGSSALIVDLDAPAYLEPGDVEEYVRRTLLASDDPLVPTPYRDRPDLVAEVAAAVAARAGPCFLVAQLCALSLTASGNPPVATAAWAEDFPATVGAAMERYLRQVQPAGAPVRDVLTALAWAEGDGLDDPSLWADMATAIGTGSYTEQDVARLLTESTVTDLLYRTRHGDRTAFRLFHDALSEHLRQQSIRYRAPADIQSRIADVLIAHLPRATCGQPDWSRAAGYTRTYLPVHAARGQALDSLLDQAGFLVTAEPARLLAALPAARTARGQRIARIVERVGQQLLQAPPQERACYVEMAAKMAADEQLARDIARFAPRRPWSVPWARWQPLDDSRLLGHHGDWVRAVATVNAPHGVIVVSASAWAVRAWHLADGAPAPGMREPASPITGMTAFRDADDIVVLTIHADGELHRAVVGAATPPQTLALDRADGPWLICHDGRAAVVTVNRDNVAEALSVSDGQPVGLPPISIAGRRVCTAGNAGQRGFLVTRTPHDHNTPTTEVAILDLADGSAVGSSFRPAEHCQWPVAIWSVVLTERAGSPALLVCPWSGGPVTLWDPIRGEQASEPHYDHAGVFSATIARVSDTDMSCWGDANGDLYLQAAGQREVNRRIAHDSGINAMAACDTPHGTFIITGGRDGAVRATNISAAVPAQSKPRGAVDELVVAPATATEPAIVAALIQGSSVIALDAADGQVLAQLPPAAGAHHRHLAIQSGQQPALITIDSRNQVAAWRLPDGQPALTWQLPADIEPEEIAVTTGEQPVLLVTLPDGRLAFFDLTSGQETRPRLSCHPARFHVVTDPDPPSGTISFLTATGHRQEPRQVRLWTVTASATTCRDLPVDSLQDMGTPTAFALTPSTMRRRMIVGVGPGSSLSAWDTDSASPLVQTRLERAHHMSLQAVDIAEIAGRELILSGGYTCSLALLPVDNQDEHHIRVGSPLWNVKSMAEDQVAIAGPRGIMLLQLSAELPGL